MSKFVVTGKTLGGGRLSDGYRVRGVQGKDQSLSRVLALGNSYRLFFPLWESETTPGTFDPEIVVCTIPVRKLDFKITGYSMYVLEDFEEGQDSTVRDLTNMEKYARVSSIIHDARYRLAVDRKVKELEDVANQLNTAVDKSTKETALAAIRKQFYGDEDKNADSSKKEYATENRAISGVMLEITTRVFVVPMKDGKPDFTGMTTAQISLSNKKIMQLLNLLKNSDYFFDNTRPFFEVGFDYTGTDKKIAGMNANFQGISKDTSIQSKSPAEWAANSEKLYNMPRDPKMIADKNFNISQSPSAEAVISAFMKYIASQPILMLHLDFDSNSMKYGAKQLYELGLLNGFDNVKQMLVEYIRDNLDEDVLADEDKQSSTDVNEIPDAVADASGVEKLSELDLNELSDNLANIDDV